MGFFSWVKKKAKAAIIAAAKAVVAAVGIIVGLSESFIHILAGIPDALLGLFGFFPEKKLRLKVVILQDAKYYKSLYSEVKESINFTATILKKQANIKLIAADEEFISQFPRPAPPEV